MSGSFTGFSEEDIKRLNNKNPSTHRKNQTHGENTNKQKPQASKRTATTENPHRQSESRTKVLNEKIKNSTSEPILESAKLNKVVESPLPPTPPPPPLPHPQTTSPINLENDNSPNPNGNSETSINNRLQNNLDYANHQHILNAAPRLVPDLARDLDEFQIKQKLIEEQNRKKKELLLKALAAKTKQTQEETQRLNEVREEFKKLDALLSNDVKILRKQIELASLDYMEAQKRYYRIEKEFLDAKLALHQRLEKKEMLTEHLCTIIEQNEERKSQKLNELLFKLNLKTIPQIDPTECTVEQPENGIKAIHSDAETVNDNDVKS